MNAKLFDYVERHNAIYNLSGATKLCCFLVLTVAVMLSFDVRFLIPIFIMALAVFRVAQIPFRQVKNVLCYMGAFFLFNMILTFLFSPTYAVEIYGTQHILIDFGGRYVLTQEQLLYQFTKMMKYVAVVPLGLVFFLTTNPSELAASLNRIGCNAKIAFSISLTLRYIPDVIRNYREISLAQQGRGLDFSQKEKFSVRVKNIVSICVPLVMTTLERIEVISNVLDLRGFGKRKKRTWYAAKKMQWEDYLAISVCGALLVLSILLNVIVNQSRFYNPFV